MEGGAGRRGGASKTGAVGWMHGWHSPRARRRGRRRVKPLPPPALAAAPAACGCSPARRSQKRPCRALTWASEKLRHPSKTCAMRRRGAAAAPVAGLAARRQRRRQRCPAAAPPTATALNCLLLRPLQESYREIPPAAPASAGGAEKARGNGMARGAAHPGRAGCRLPVVANPPVALPGLGLDPPAVQDAAESAPESGTMRGEGEYPFNRERSGASSSEDEGGASEHGE